MDARINYKMKRDERKSIIGFSISSFLNDLGSDMIRPFWPLFVTSFLGAPMMFLGFLDGLGDMISYSIRFPVGYLSDKLKQRKIFIWLGYLFAGLSRVGYAVSSFFYMLIPFKILDRLGKLRDPPRDAMLSLIAKKKERGRYFGIITAADNLGAACGPLAGFLLFDYLGYRNLFLLAALPSLIGAFVIFFLVKEKKFVKINHEFSFRFKNLSKNLKRLIFISGLFALSWFSLSFMTVFVSKYISIKYLPLLFFVMSLFASLISVIAGKYSDYVGRKYLLSLGYLLFGFVCLGFIYFNIAYALLFSFGLFILYGIHYGIVTSLQSVFVSDLSKKDIRGSAIGLFQTVFGVCALPASLIAGFLWDKISIVSVFWYGLILSFVSAFLLVLFVKKN